MICFIVEKHKLDIHVNTLLLWRRKYAGKEKSAPVRKARLGGKSEVEQLRHDLVAVTEKRDILRIKSSFL